MHIHPILFFLQYHDTLSMSQTGDSLWRDNFVLTEYMTNNSGFFAFADQYGGPGSVGTTDVRAEAVVYMVIPTSYKRSYYTKLPYRNA